MKKISMAILIMTIAAWEPPAAAQQGVRPALTSPLVNAPADSGGNFERLGGDLPKVLGGKDHAMYLVTADIYVPSGKTVRIEPGTALLFKNFTGMHVEGKLLAQGTREKPIVFTSEFDDRFRPADTIKANAYDWNGIYIHESGLATLMANCEIVYSVYGINSLTKFIKLENVRFADNGRADLTIEDQKVAVTPEPFSYAVAIKDARINGVPVEILMDPEMPKRNTLRYSGIGILAGGISMGTWFFIQQSRDRQKIEDMADTSITGVNSPLVEYSLSDFNRALRQRDTDLGLAITGFCLSFLGALGVGFSFTF
jgi:hypothetical protein